MPSLIIWPWFIRHRFNSGDSNNIENQKGKVAVVTGANNAIGFETTVGLAQVEYKVIMACRSMEKARKAKEEITERVPSAELDIIELDLSKLTAVREFASQFRSKSPIVAFS